MNTSKIKRIIAIFLIGTIAFLINNDNAYADDYKTCTYLNGKFIITYHLTDDPNNESAYFSGQVLDVEGKINETDLDLNKWNFFVDNIFTCPDIYYEPALDSNNNSTYNISYQKKNDYYSRGKSTESNSSTTTESNQENVTTNDENTTGDTNTSTSTNESNVCLYIGKKQGNRIIITKAGNSWRITYPDGTNSTEDSLPFGMNLANNCKMDFYYIGSKKKIVAATSENTFESLCDSYSQNDIEYYCSGTCNYSVNNICPASSSGAACPTDLQPAFKILRKIFIPIIQILVPIVLILLGSIDFARATLTNDEKGIKDATNRFIRRCIAAVIIFFAVVIVNVIMGAIAKVPEIQSQNNWASCWTYLE